MADDNSQDLKIHIITDADNTGFKSAASAASELGAENSKTAVATEELSTKQQHGAEHANVLHKNHGALHKILHLIASETGPAAGAALASLGALAGGGIMLAVMAVKELIEMFKAAEEAAEKLKEKAREAFVELTEQSQEAEESVHKTKKAIEDFWDALNKKTAQDSVKTAFDSEIQQFKNIAKAAEEAGLITKQQGDEYVFRHEQAAKMMRAVQLDQSVGDLSGQLERLKTSTTGDEAKKREMELLALKADKDKVEEAYKKGESFRPTSVVKDSVGVLSDRTLNSPEAEVTRKQQFTNIQGEINRQITEREEARTKIQEHVKEVESEIGRRTGESAALKADVDKGRIAEATTDFATGKKLANRYTNGQSLNTGEQQYIITLEQAITGHKQSLDSAVNLLLAQAKNGTVTALLLESAHGRISVVDTKLNQLLGQVKSIPTTK